MKAQSKKLQRFKGRLASLLRLVALGIKKYVIELLDVEAAIEAAQKEQVFTEAKIKEAFLQVAGSLRYWKAEMVQLVPALIGLGLRHQDPWEHWIKFAPIQEMERLGYKDRVIGLAIDTANILKAVSNA